MGLSSSDVARLVATGSPLLFLDTCSLLDVMRDPTREKSRSDDLTCAMELLEHAKNGTMIAMLPDQVKLELKDHIDLIQEETRRALLKHKQTIARVDAIAAVYGPATVSPTLHLNDHEVRARVVVDRWIAASNNAPQSDGIAGLALTRVNQARTPAKKGTNSMKDCVVVETCMEAASLLREGGLKAPMVFLSANTNDYTTESGSALKPDLALEFAPLGLSFAPNYRAARHALGL